MKMLSKFVAAAVLGSALIAAPVLAQNSKMNEPKASTAAMNETASAAGVWQGSKIIGLNVYNDQNEKIGSIKDLMVDKSGNIASAVIGVGGFLGMGERDVAVKFADLKWSNEPVRSSNAAGGAGNTTTRPATTGAGNATAANAPKTYPDHAVFNASKDQLKAMPQFDYNK
jgi:sporulation protein YlmC with PRC-barrel domain